MKEKMAALLKEINSLREKSQNGTLTEEEGKQFDTKVAEARALKAEIEEADRRAKDADEMAELDKHFNQGTGSRARTVTTEMREDAKRNGDDKQKVDTRSASERFVASDSYKDFLKRGAPKGARTEAVDVGSFFHRAAAQAPDVSGLSAEELRTLVYTGAFPIATGSPSLVAPNRLPGVYTPDMPQLTARNAFLNLQTNSPVIQFFRELTFTNNAAFVSEAVATGSSTGLKPESALTFESASVTAEILGHWIPVTNNTLEDEPQMRGIIEGRLIDGLKLAEDDAIINGDGTSPNISGLLDVSGTQAANGAYFAGAGNAVENAGTDWEDFDRITRARRLVRTVGRATASFVLISPADLERLVTITDNNGQYYSGSPFGDIGLTRMRGLQVIETEALDEGTAIVGDGRMAAVFDRMAATVTAGWIDQQFVRNMLTLLAEERLAFAVFRPAAFVVLDLTSHA